MSSQTTTAPLRQTSPPLQSSAIRDLLAVAQQPGIISLAGGLPAAELFPLALVAEAAAEELGSPAALQYSSTQGDDGLREWIARGHDVEAEAVIITHGSQQALDLVARALVSPGAAVVLSEPGYVGAIQVFRAAGADLAGVPSDDDGLRVDVLADCLARGLRPALVYVVPNFDNPTGATLSVERREWLCHLAETYGFWILADDPYAELRWRGAALPPLRELSERVITLGSFSKVLCPGLRVGYAVAPAEVVTLLVLHKQAADLHTSTLAQRLVRRVVETPGFFPDHVRLLRRVYQERASALVAAVEDAASGHLVVTRPDGGMFVWARLVDPAVDAGELLGVALACGVAFVPGAAFEVSARHPHALRLSFATVRTDQLVEGIHRLAGALEQVSGDLPVSR